MEPRWEPPTNLFRRDPTGGTLDDVRGPPLTDEMVAVAESILGVRLPSSYVELMRLSNGGHLVADLGCPTTEATSWAADHVGVADRNGIPDVHDHDPTDPSWDGGGILCSPYMSRDWDLPDGLVLLTGDGHTWIALDFRTDQAEPPVIFFDADSRHELRLARDFASFIAASAASGPKAEPGHR